MLSAAGVEEGPLGGGKWIGRDPNPFLAPLIGGWSANGLMTAMSGEPFSVRSGVFTSNASHQSRADLVGSKPSTALKDGPAGPYVLSPSLVTDVYNFATPGFKVPLPGDDGLGRNIFIC